MIRVGSIVLLLCSVSLSAGEAPNKCNKVLLVPFTGNNIVESDNEYVILRNHTTNGTNKADGLEVERMRCYELSCIGSASPHRKIIWYRLLDDQPPNSTGLPITSLYWSKYYYETPTTLQPNKGVSSSLIIRKFNEGYVGRYYCRVTNDEEVVRSPLISLKLHVRSNQPDTNPPPNPPPLRVRNITAIRINDNSVLIKWVNVQRNKGNRFCKILRKGTERSQSFVWKLEVLQWDNWTSLVYDENFKKYTMKEHFAFNSNKIRFVTLKKSDCVNRSYLLTNLSLTAYYKFQIIVDKMKKEVVGKTMARNGSHIHYFGKQTDPKIVYPKPLATVCEPSDSNIICRAEGEPTPRIQLLAVIAGQHKYTCLAESVHFDESGNEKKRYDIVDFYWNTSSCNFSSSSSPPPKPSCVPMPNTNSVCNQYISQGSLIYVPGDANITELEEMAEANINQLNKTNLNCYQYAVQVICHSYLAPCYLKTPTVRGVCPQSCNAVASQCGEMFEKVQSELPEWSPARNCSSVRQGMVAGDSPECIYLSKPSVEEENHADDSCIVGKGTTYTGNVSAPGCIDWNDEGQIYYDVSVFPELGSAGSSCRNPGGSGDRPWCYTNLASNLSSSRWKYCDIPTCSSCERVPGMCRAVYNDIDMTVYVKNNSYPTTDMPNDCFPANDKCYEVWKTVICHLSYPKCIEAKEKDKLHTSMPLCRSYCYVIKNITSKCPILDDCNKSLFVYNIDNMSCADLPEENCMSADLPTEPPTGPLIGNKPMHQTNQQLAISIYVAAAVCLFSVFTIVAIIVGYCCCLYTHDSSMRQDELKLTGIEMKLAKNEPMFAAMKFNYIETTDMNEKDTSKSLRSISKSKIHYIRDLGSGNFGLVYQGKVEGLKDGEEFTMAAIKTLREGTSAEGIKSFLHEAKLACQFDHENIIKLYGICMSESFYCLLFEYMDLGDLNEFLRNSASSSQRRIMNPLDSSLRSRTESSLSNNPAGLNPQQLISICHQISLGMEYFASLNHVHRDLATRNCLVSTGLVVKIGDFGMSQTLYHSDYYKQKGEQALPVRWMAPEAFIYGRFSTEGDVWSFGVVMWEVFSFAMQPYYGKMNDQVMNEVRRGHTLSRPDDCPDSAFEIMRSCWQMESHRRPTFTELVEELSNWKPTRCSTSTALESQGSTKDDNEDSLSLSTIQDKDLEMAVFDECNMSGTEEDIAD